MDQSGAKLSFPGYSWMQVSWEATVSLQHCVTVKAVLCKNCRVSAESSLVQENWKLQMEI